MPDGRIDEGKHRIVHGFFSEFITLFDNRTIVSPSPTEGASLVGLSAVCPKITFSDSTFCFTGASSKFTRSEFTGIVSRLGGDVLGGMSAKLNYLVISR